MKVNMLYAFFGIGTLSVGYLGYYQVSRRNDANKCPVDHKSRTEMVDMGRSKKQKRLE